MSSHYTIYTMPNCPHCVAAKELFKRENLEFTEVTEFTREELLDLVGPVRTLPQILVKDKDGLFHIGGFSDLKTMLSGSGATVRKIG